MTQEKLPPHDDAAEEAVVGSLLIEGEAISEVVDFLKLDDFFSERYSWIYGASLALYRRGDGINEVTVARELAQTEKLEKVGGAAFLSGLISRVPTPFHIQYYGKIVANLAVCRRLISIGGAISQMGFAADPDLGKTLERAGLLVKNLTDSHSSEEELVGPEQSMVEAAAMYHDIDDGVVSAIQTPFPTLNYEIGGGFYPGELWYLGGRPGNGKTELMLQLARFTAVHQGFVLVVSKEMPRRQLYHRHVSAADDIDIRDLRRGDLDEDQRAARDAAVGQLATLQMKYLSRDRGVRITVPRIRSKALQMRDSCGLALVVVDYVQILQAEEGDRSRPLDRVTEISRGLQDLAQEVGVPLVVGSQLNRSSLMRDDKAPDLGDLRESGALEQDADGVLMVHRPLDSITKKMLDVQLILAKLRQGGASGIIPFKWEHNQYEEVHNPLYPLPVKEVTPSPEAVAQVTQPELPAQEDLPF